MSETIKTNLPYVLVTLALCVLTVTALSEAYVEHTPERDLATVRDHFLQKLPNVPLTEFINGTYALDEQAYLQWQEIEQFPPYEISIERGKELFSIPFANGLSYQDCFRSSPAEIRQYYPYFSTSKNQVRTLLLDLNQCRSRNGEPLLDYDRGDLVAIEAYLSELARGRTIAVKVEGDAAIDWYTEGKRLFFMKRGQMNFSCADCHIYNAGGSLSGQTLSPAIGQVSHFPVYRAAWGEIGGLHRRYAECMSQIGAEPFKSQSKQFRSLEYFHSFLSNDLKFNGPGYRK